MLKNILLYSLFLVPATQVFAGKPSKSAAVSQITEYDQKKFEDKAEEQDEITKDEDSEGNEVDKSKASAKKIGRWKKFQNWVVKNRLWLGASAIVIGAVAAFTSEKSVDKKKDPLGKNPERSKPKSEATDNKEPQNKSRSAISDPSSTNKVPGPIILNPPPVFTKEHQQQQDTKDKADRLAADFIAELNTRPRKPFEEIEATLLSQLPPLPDLPKTEPSSTNKVPGPIILNPPPVFTKKHQQQQDIKDKADRLAADFIAELNTRPRKPFEEIEATLLSQLPPLPDLPKTEPFDKKNVEKLAQGFMNAIKKQDELKKVCEDETLLKIRIAEIRTKIRELEPELKSHTERRQEILNIAGPIAPLWNLRNNLFKKQRALHHNTMLLEIRVPGWIKIALIPVTIDNSAFPLQELKQIILDLKEKGEQLEKIADKYFFNEHLFKTIAEQQSNFNSDNLYKKTAELELLSQNNMMALSEKTEKCVKLINEIEGTFKTFKNPESYHALCDFLRKNPVYFNKAAALYDEEIAHFEKTSKKFLENLKKEKIGPSRIQGEESPREEALYDRDRLKISPRLLSDE